MTRPARAARATGLFLAAAATMFVLAWFGMVLSRHGGAIATVWFANAVFIAWLVRCPRQAWSTLLVALFAGYVVAGWMMGDGLALSAALAAANAGEVLLVGWLFARNFGPRGSFHSLDHLGRLALLALAGAALSTPLAGLGLALLGPAVSLQALLHWALADSLGILVLTPLLLVLTGPSSNEGGASRFEFALLIALIVVVTTWVFTRHTSVMFLLTPLLVFAGLRIRIEQAVVLVTLVCGLAILLTLSGAGPLNRSALDPSLQTFLLQAFMATVVTLLLPIAALQQERRRTADALRTREEQYRLLADHSSDLVLRLDAGGRALFVSNAARHLLGLSAEALAGPVLVSRLHPDDLPRFRSVLARSRLRGDAVSCFRMRHADGHYRWIEAHCRLVGDASRAASTQHSCEAARQGRCLSGSDAPCGGPLGVSDGVEDHAPNSRGDDGGTVTIVATLRDIHERRMAELLASESAIRLRESNRLLLMAEGLASLGHWVYDPHSGEVLLSAEAAAVLRVPQLTFEPLDLRDLICPEDRRHLLRAVALARRYDAPAQCTLRIARPDGERTLQLRVQQRETLHGEIGLFGVISDITDKLLAEQRLVTALDEARQSAEFRSQFLATMSHEIRTPMTGVVGMIELLSEEPSPKQRRLYLDTLRRSADLLMTVLNDILDFSKVDSGHLEFADEPFDLGDLFRTTLHLFERPAVARGLQLALDAPMPGTLWLRGDALRLQQVLSNLVSNAIKFSERGEVAVRCSVHPRAGGRKAIRITVADCGIGISAHVRTRLFEPFVQGPTGASAGGTGLGLAICRRLVAGMGGSISLRSTEGRGSTFTIDLTLPSAVGAVAAPATLPLQQGRSLDVLLAEDNDINQLLVTALLRRMGHRVTCAKDGEEALVAAAARRFDIILMDMQMPRRSGLSAATAIRHGAGPNRVTPILALTADTAAERRSLYEGGAIDQLLAKPVDSAALRQALIDWSAEPEPSVRSRRSGEIVPVAAPTPAPPPLDEVALDQIRAMLGPPRLDDLLDLLAIELDSRPRALREALADQALDRAAAEAHSLKGAAANLGAIQVSAAALALEQAIEAALVGDREGLAPALRALAEAVSHTQHALAALPRFRPDVAIGA